MSATEQYFDAVSGIKKNLNPLEAVETNIRMLLSVAGWRDCSKETVSHLLDVRRDLKGSGYYNKPKVSGLDA